MRDGDNSLYLADDASYQRKEAELAKKLVCPLSLSLRLTRFKSTF